MKSDTQTSSGRYGASSSDRTWAILPGPENGRLMFRKRHPGRDQHHGFSAGGQVGSFRHRIQGSPKPSDIIRQRVRQFVSGHKDLIFGRESGYFFSITLAVMP